MKSVLISTQPKWCEKICHKIGTNKNGKPIYEKTIEVRKTKPSIPTPFKCYIYCCKAKSQWRYSDYEGAYENSEGEIVYAQQHIIGEFICDEVEEINCLVFISKGYEIDTCLTYKEFYEYGKGKPLYGWHITDLKIYDEPKELSEFKRPCSYKGLCFSCKRAHFYGDGSFVCTSEVTRPPKSWCYVQELEELEK